MSVAELCPLLCQTPIVQRWITLAKTTYVLFCQHFIEIYPADIEFYLSLKKVMKSARLQCQRWLKIINKPLNYTFNGYTNNAPTIFHLFIPSIGFFKMKHLLYQQRNIVFCKFLPQYLARRGRLFSKTHSFDIL